MDSSVAPYLIVNATLDNKSGDDWTFPFEFTRDYCGNDVLGYIPTKGFGKPIVRRYWNDLGTVESVKVKGGNIFGRTKPFRISEAVSASGAALSPTGRSFITWLGGSIGALINLNSQYQTRNYGKHKTLFGGFFRAFLTDKLYYSVKSNTLALSDGGHYDNLGVVALVKRKAKQIIVIDATGDQHYRYSSLRQSMEAVSKEKCSETCLGFKWEFSDDPEFPFRNSGERPFSYIMNGRITCKCTKPVKLDVFYVKATVLDSNKGARNSDGTFHQIPPTVERWLEAGHSEFPHVSTIKQVWPWSEFEAYRQLGWFIGTELAGITENKKAEDNENPTETKGREPSKEFQNPPKSDIEYIRFGK